MISFEYQNRPGTVYWDGVPVGVIIKDARMKTFKLFLSGIFWLGDGRIARTTSRGISPNELNVCFEAHRLHIVKFKANEVLKVAYVARWQNFPEVRV